MEYHDLAGLFPSISDQLHSRLPLRNLNWKSPKRPLRSIDSLHVNLAKAPTDGVAVEDSSRPSSVASQVPGGPPALKERRHQIPGLRQTPYVKLLLLRCDDSESYKTSIRKTVREWLKAHTITQPSSSSKKTAQENHDAFEWMILHVAMPGTPAAAEAMTNTSGGRSESSSSDKSKFLNRSSSTILEKLKADSH